MAPRTKPAACCAPRTVRRLSRRNLDRLVSVARALADPHRIEILRLLAAQHGPLCACDIVERYDLSQPTISHHLRILRDANLLRATREGLWTFYELQPDGVSMLESLDGLLGKGKPLDRVAAE